MKNFPAPNFLMRKTKRTEIPTRFEKKKKKGHLELISHYNWVNCSGLSGCVWCKDWIEQNKIEHNKIKSSRIVKLF